MVALRGYLSVCRVCVRQAVAHETSPLRDLVTPAEPVPAPREEPPAQEREDRPDTVTIAMAVADEIERRAEQRSRARMEKVRAARRREKVA
jgi:hypothetical protein